MPEVVDVVTLVDRNDGFCLYTAHATQQDLENDPTLKDLQAIPGFSFQTLNYGDPAQHAELHRALGTWRPQIEGHPNPPLHFPFMVYIEHQTVQTVLSEGYPTQAARFVIGRADIKATDWLSLQNYVRP